MAVCRHLSQQSPLALVPHRAPGASVASVAFGRTRREKICLIEPGVAPIGGVRPSTPTWPAPGAHTGAEHAM